MRSSLHLDPLEQVIAPSREAPASQRWPVNAFEVTEHTAPVTVMFADMRGYTRLAERLTLGQLVPLLQEFFKHLLNETRVHHGTVYHLAGDCLMSAYGMHALESQASAQHALAASRAMLIQFAGLSARWYEEYQVETGLGIGLHLGEVAITHLGMSGHRVLTLVGDTVNVAARLCDRARAGEVLLSSSVVNALDASPGARTLASAEFLPLPQYVLRGRAEPLDIWCVPAPLRLAI